MNFRDIATVSIYENLMSALGENGFSKEESVEIFSRLTAQAEMEVVEEIIGKLSREKLQLLDGLSDNYTADEVAQKLGIEANDVDAIRAEKTALLVREVMPLLEARHEG